MRKAIALKSISALLLAGVSASAFALTPGSGTWVKETNAFGAQNLYTYVPKNPNPEVLAGKRALMISLHGCAMTATNVINKGFNWETTAEKYGMVVLAPTVPTTSRQVSGCWDWFGANHSRSTRDEAVILKMVDAIKARPELDIDTNQIYVTGLSSGGGLVIDLGCVAPDYFAGMGINAGPALNTPATAGIGSKSTRTAQQVADDCKAYAGNYRTYLQTQVTSVVNGSADGLVDPTHDWTNRDGMKLAYGATTSAGTFTETQSKGQLFQDSASKIRVSYIEGTGMGHAWPAGEGGSGGGTYVDYKHVNYPAYVTKFFFDNNLRVVRDPNTTTTTTTSSTSSSSTSTSSTSSTTKNSTTSSSSSTTSSSSSTTKTSTTSTSSTTITTGTTTSTTQAPAECVTASNFAHILSGRAYNFWGFAYALGSNQYMGLASTFSTTSLKKSGVFSYTVGCN